MGGKVANGWRFWSLDGEAPAAEPAAEKPKAKQANGKNGKLISRTPNQKGLAEGQTRWFCNA